MSDWRKINEWGRGLLAQRSFCTGCGGMHGTHATGCPALSEKPTKTYTLKVSTTPTQNEINLLILDILHHLDQKGSCKDLIKKLEELING